MRAVSVLFLASFAALSMSLTDPPSLQAQEAPLLVTSEWLAERIDEEGLVLLHVGNEESYVEGHIPGARHAPSQRFAPEVDGLSTQMPEAADFRHFLEEAGVSTGSRIVVYSASALPQLAARLYVTLEHFGMAGRASLLDGGLPTWRAEGRRVDSEPRPPAPGSLPELREEGEFLVDHSFVEGAMDGGDTAVLDARDRPFWTGEQQLSARADRPGRIPGAFNIPFRSLVDESGRFLPPSRIERLFADAGVEPDQAVVTYCHVGQQASLLFVAARLIERDARLYGGSYEDWSRRSELPVEVGEDGGEGGTEPEGAIARRTAPMESQNGLIPLHYEEATGRLFLEVDRLNEELIYSNALAHGMGSNRIGLDPGMPEPYRTAYVEGVEWWSEIFEVAGLEAIEPGEPMVFLSDRLENPETAPAPERRAHYRVAREDIQRFRATGELPVLWSGVIPIPLPWP